MQDLTIVCLCGRPFTFTIGEQQFFQKKGFVPPKRCPECRAKKRRFEQDIPFPSDDGWKERGRNGTR